MQSGPIIAIHKLSPSHSITAAAADKANYTARSPTQRPTVSTNHRPNTKKAQFCLVFHLANSQFKGSKVTMREVPSNRDDHQLPAW